MFAQATSSIIGALLIWIVFVCPASAQCGAADYPVGGRAEYQRDLGGEIYYYDRAGTPLYYDDYVHYSYPRRFIYSNGGWVLLSSGRSYYGRHPGGAYAAHHGSSYGGYHPSSYSRARAGNGTGQGVAHVGGPHRGPARGHGNR